MGLPAVSKKTKMFSFVYNPFPVVLKQNLRNRSIEYFFIFFYTWYFEHIGVTLLVRIGMGLRKKKENVLTSRLRGWKETFRSIGVNRRWRQASITLYKRIFPKHSVRHLLLSHVIASLSLSKSSWNSFRRRCFSILWRVCIWSSKKKPDAFLFFTLINQKEIKMELDFYSSNEDLTILNADLEDISASGCCCCCCCCCCAGSSW